jgi:hypothetical protein
MKSKFDKLCENVLLEFGGDVVSIPRLLPNTYYIMPEGRSIKRMKDDEDDSDPWEWIIKKLKETDNFLQYQKKLLWRANQKYAQHPNLSEGNVI